MILVACEWSQAVTRAFREMGVDAVSCDLEPAEVNDDWHYQGDVMDILYQERWKAVIAFPPCDHLAVSGARWFEQKRADGRQQAGIDFFMLFANHPAKFTCIENPVGIMSTEWRKPDQIIQPWQFGHPESKKTCLWLKSLPPLEPTNVLPTPPNGRWSNQTPSGQNKLGPSKDRAKMRGRTYTGIAEAMAQQWAGVITGHGERQ